MALKRHKPTSPARRGLVLVARSGLWKSGPEKRLTAGASKSGGRNNHGRLTARRKGGGHKRRYRRVDFRRAKTGISATVERLEYDPNRSAFIALIRYEDDELAYILAPQGLKTGDVVLSGSDVGMKIGNAMKLADMPVGAQVHNVEMKPGKGGQIARAAGSSAQLQGYENDYAILRLSSGEQRLVPSACMATVGTVSNPDHVNRRLAKAGRNRWLGRRPIVRGVAKNPVDHPHGGGEGRSSGGRHPVTPWGRPTKGHRTRSKKRSNRLIIRSRHRRRAR